LRSAFLIKVGLEKESFVGTGTVSAVVMDVARLLVYGLSYYTTTFVNVSRDMSRLVLAGWRAALISILSLAGMLALGNWLGPITARPRPSRELVHVFRPLSGYSFPSLFALRYAATFGFLAVLATVKCSGTLRVSVLAGCIGLLILGWFARVALAAHWPSDVIISYYLGLLWAAFVIRVARLV